MARVFSGNRGGSPCGSRPIQPERRVLAALQANGVSISGLRQDSGRPEAAGAAQKAGRLRGPHPGSPLVHVAPTRSEHEGQALKVDAAGDTAHPSRSYIVDCSSTQVGARSW
jgi:hypothetical protein